MSEEASISPQAAALAKAVYAAAKEKEMDFIDLVQACAALLITIAQKAQLTDAQVTNELKKQITRQRSG